MAHHKVLYIGHDLEKAIAPYDENNRDKFVAVNHTEHYLNEYEAHKNDNDFLKEYPNGTFADFLSYWIGLPLVEKENEAEAREKKEHFVLLKENGEVEEVILFINPDTQLHYYEIVHDFNGDYNYRKELESEKKTRRTDWKEALKALGHVPKFESWGEVIHKVLSGSLGDVSSNENTLEVAQDYYYNQPDRKVLGEILPYVEDYIGSCETEENYVSRASLPYYAILTDDGWVSQVPGSYYLGITGEPLPDKEWLKVQIAAVKKATSTPNYKAYILNTKI